jgi:hypothetical protein
LVSSYGHLFDQRESMLFSSERSLTSDGSWKLSTQCSERVRFC